jgi:putative ABC transport system ATP-binding protein
MAPTISARDIDFSFGEGELRKQILFRVSFDIQPGEIILLTGPSGSGKTTLLTLIGGLRAMQSGSLKLFGREMSGMSQREFVDVRRRIGFIFQQHNLLGFLSARQNVMMSLQLNSKILPSDRSRIAMDMLGLVGLSDRVDYEPARLSGGQKQRVAIARALVNRPELILADEPTAALDSVNGREVVNLLKRLAREQGCPVLMVTHDPRVLDVADRVLSMEDGRLKSNS